MSRALRTPMCRADVEAILNDIQYTRQPNWRINLHWRELRGVGGDPDKPVLVTYLQVACTDPDEPWTGRKWTLSPFMTRTEVVYTAFNALFAAEEHELRETFLYKGHAVCGPHYDVDAMIRLQDQGQVDVRADAMQGA